MSRKPAALLSLIVALCGCVDGGSRGSGISTAVLGNVARVQTGGPESAAAGGATTDVGGIDVSIEGTSIHDLTDAGGDFSLVGNFEGMVNVIFRLADGSWQARMAINVPAAGQLTLNNVTVDTDTEEAYAERQDVDFTAIISGVDCQDMILILVSSVSGDDDQYRLRLDTSTVQDSDGNPVSCGDLRGGEQAHVVGLVYPDGDFGEATVTLED